MNFSRKTILVVGAALLAACGDKVTVQEYTPPTQTSKVNFVEVTPATATVNTGASITFTAAVNADAGLATTVTWTASAGTVTSAGVFTAPATANPGISVCATSTVDTGKKGCATVVVSPPVAQIPASISIASITAAGNLNAPVNPAAVIGQIDVRLNVNPGNQTVSKIVLVVGGIRTDSQTFTAAQSAALRYAADEAVTAQTTFPQVVFSINTAAFNATTGIPTWANGARSISAQLYTTQSGTATAATATVATSLTFANADTYVLTLGAAATTANSTPGYAYRSGNLVVSVLPVIYNTGRAIGTATLSFGTVGCDNTIPGANRTRALTAPAAGSSLWTTTFDAADVNGPLASNVTGYEFNALACNPAIGEGFILTAADANGNAMLTAVAPANGPVVRLDNLAPTVPTLAVVGGALTIGVRTGGWINDAVMFTGTSVANGAIAVAGVEGGVGGLTYRAAVGGVTMTSAATLAESQAANDYTVSVYSRDALGNESLNVDATFAVDRTAPTVAFGADPASNTGYAAGIASWVGTSVTDPATAPALASGFVGLGGTPLTVAQTRRNATNTRNYCPTSNTFEATTFVCAAWVGTTTNYASVMQINTNDVAAGDSYITTTATVFDQAGNTSAAVTRVFATDASAPTVALLTPFTIPANGASLAVTGSMVDNLHLRGQQIDFTVAGGTPTGVAAVAGSTDRFFPIAPAAVDAYNPTTLTTSGGFSQTIPRFIAQWQIADAAVFPVASTYAAQVATSALSGVAVNVASTASAAVAAGNTPIVAPASAAIIGSGIYHWGAPLFLTTAGGAATSISRDAVSTTISATRLIRVDLNVPLTTANPFERVQFWAYQDGTGTLNPTLLAGNLNGSRAGWRYLGEVTQATVIDAATRIWRFEYTWNPTADQLPFRADVATRVMAVGVNGGSALMSPASATIITVVP